MAIKECPNGHHYNTDDYANCPYCTKEKSGKPFDWSNGADHGQSNIEGGWDRPTETIGTRTGSDVMGTGRRFEGSGGETEPLDSYRLQTHGDDSYREDMVTERIKSNDEDETRANWNRDEYNHQPVVGWLVCIEGPDKGKDFCLHGAKSAIGRREGSSVYLSDPKISRDGYPALIVYDNRKSHRFYLASGDASSRNNVELDGEMLLDQSIIQPYDEIRIEDTVLVFVPFCGEDFYWKEA